ncbi:hypothetical protein NXY56_001358 [Leishmania guyanensis]
MCMRVSMRSYHHNPYRQSSASYTPQETSHRQQGQLRTLTRASTEPPLPSSAPDLDDSIDRFSSQSSEATGGIPAHSTLSITRSVTVTFGARASVATASPTTAPFHWPSSVANIEIGGTTTLATSTIAATASTRDSVSCRMRLAQLSSPFDAVNLHHPSLASPRQGISLPRSRHSGDAGGDDPPFAGDTTGSLPSTSTSTLYSGALLQSCQALLSTQSLGSTVLMERHSFSDWCATAALDDPSSGSCPSSCSWSPLNQTQPRSAVRATATSPISPVGTITTTLFIDGLPASIENKWQLQPCVPPQGLMALRVKSSRGRNVGFAVYDSIAAAHGALTWFNQMRIIKEVVLTSTFGAPPAVGSAPSTGAPPGLVSDDPCVPAGGVTSACFTNLPVESEPLPLKYEDYLCTQQLPSEFASLLRKCTLLRVDWARCLEIQHTPVKVVGAAAPPPSSLVSSPLSHPPSPWRMGAVAVRPPPPPPMPTSVPHVSPYPRGDNDGCFMSEPARHALLLQAPPQQHPPPPPSSSPPIVLSPRFQLPLQPPHPCAPAGWSDAQATHPLEPHPLAQTTLYHGPSPVTHRTWATSAPSSFLQRTELRSSCGSGTATPAYYQPENPTTWQPLGAHLSSHVAERNDQHERVDDWRGVPPKLPGSSYRYEERHPQQRHMAHHHHQPAREPPLPSRTLFVRLIHNFEEPQCLQHDQLRSTTGGGTDSATAVPINPSFATVGPRSTTSGTMAMPDAAAACAEVVALPAPTRARSQTTPSFRVSTSTAVSLSGAAGIHPLVSVVPHHHHCMLYQSPALPTLMTTPQLRSPQDSHTAQAYSPLRPPVSSQLTSPRDDRHSSSAGAADEAVLQPTPNAEDLEFFRFAQSVLRKEYFSERFAGFVRYREFLRPPYYGGCFVLFERGEDMQRCLQWMRKDERLMKLFAVSPARNDSFGP